MEEKCYYYRGRVASVYDGDTCRVDIDLGFGIWMKKEILRLHRINAPEMRGAERPAGQAARDFLREMILEQDVIVQTLRDSKGKYGRYLAEIWLFDNLNKQWLNINELMVEKGHAQFKEY